MIDEKKFIERLKILMRESGCEGNAAAFGELSGCTGRTVLNALNGKIPGVQILSGMLKGKRSVSWLLGEENSDRKVECTNEPGEFRSLCVKNLEVVFEFIGEKYGKDALGIQIFLDAMQEEFHDYRAWRHEKLMERISEEKKQAVGGSEDIPQKLVSGKNGTRSR